MESRDTVPLFLTSSDKILTLLESLKFPKNQSFIRKCPSFTFNFSLFSKRESVRNEESVEKREKQKEEKAMNIK